MCNKCLRTKMSPEVVQRAIDMALDGMPAKDIADSFGVSRNTLNAAMKSAGFRYRYATRHNRINLVKLGAVRDREDGMTVQEIAAKYGVNKRVVYQILGGDT